ncbi:MAG: hypothetical protein EYC68_11175 [Chloroflexota bacterium]|nr:MAG: hypothetical protein EYC68_11175 [Chloroflexota bacterium]
MNENFVLSDQQEVLALSFIEEYLRREGYSFEMLGTLPEERVKPLMVKASVYASTRLAEIENRAQLVTSLHHTTESLL